MYLILGLDTGVGSYATMVGDCGRRMDGEQWLVLGFGDGMVLVLLGRVRAGGNGARKG